MNLTEEISRNGHLCASISYQVADIASALSRIGLDRLAKELDDIGPRLEESAKRLRNAYGEELSANLHHSKHMAGLLLQATLKGVLAPTTTEAQ